MLDILKNSEKSKIEKQLLGNVIIHTTRIWEVYKKKDSGDFIFEFDWSEESQQKVRVFLAEDFGIMQFFGNFKFKVLFFLFLFFLA